MDYKLHIAALMFVIVIDWMNVRGELYHINIQADNVTSTLNHFWESTGLCPPEPHQQAYKYFLSEDEKQNLAYIGSVPHGGIKQVRIHWLLDMVTLGFDQDDISIAYNFTLLDQLIDTLWQNHLRPGFELMGNPSNYFTDFEDRKQLFMWKNMVTVLAKRYIDKYGLKYVSTWNFETWNEPDHKDFDGLNFTVQGYLNYYDACSEGLKAASPSLILGAPGAACRQPSFSVLCWALLDHCDNGINYFTYEAGVRLDYISFHHKGKGHSMYILDTELDTIENIHNTYPGLSKVPIVNNEADPLVGWSKPEEWRADATYAAVVAKVLGQHQNLLLSQRPDINYALLSNDNGFMNFYPSYFDQRTLTARFQINNTKPQYVDFIKKPVLSVMGLLALLGDQQVEARTFIRVRDTFAKVSNDSDVGTIASIRQSKTGKESWQMGVLIYNSADTSNTTSTDSIQVDIHGLNYKGTSRLYCIYLIDNRHGNPYAFWKSQGKPVFPTRKQLQEMRGDQEPVRIKGPLAIDESSLRLYLSVDKPGVVLLHMCEKPAAPPSQITGIRLHHITSLDTLVIWDDIDSYCLLTYQVEWSSSGKEGPYHRVNTQDIIFTSYVHSMEGKQGYKPISAGESWYRVCAVDYWDQMGKCSTPVNRGHL